MKRQPLLLALLLSPTLVFAAEGMWTLDHPPLAQMRKELGTAPDAALLTKLMRGSARIAGGCSASFVSPEGLVLTNHHCVAECVEQLSTASQDRLRDGFLAKNRAEEANCPAMEVNRLESITDVTPQVRAATKGLSGEAFSNAFNAIKAKLAADCVGSDSKTQRCDVVDLYRGGQYKLYQYHRFQDVRLAFAPEQAIANFGGDPDNFNFPRYDLDMALIRVYENGQPAVVKDYLPFRREGAAAGEAVYVTGHPGATQRSLTVAQLQALRNHAIPARLLNMAEYRGRLAQYSRSGTEQARMANSELFYLENGFKVYKGELDALNDPQLFAAKQAEEAALRRFVASRPALAKTHGQAWAAIEQALARYEPLRTLDDQLAHGKAFNSQLFQIARTLVRGAVERSKPNEQRLPEFAEAGLPTLEAELFSAAPIYPEFEKIKLGFSLEKMRELLGADAPLVKRVLGKQSPDQLAAQWIDGSKLADVALRRQLWNGGEAAVRQSQDPFIQLALSLDDEARALRKRVERELDAVVQKNAELIAQARFAMKGDSVYPDATFTLRLSYGRVEGWQEGEQAVPPFTTLGGTFERATGAEPFALPASWLNARSRLNPAQPFNLSSSNDIIGGNSGSPMVNARGEVVGLVFDGNIHSIGGAFAYDPRLNRTVAVHAGAIAETLDKVYDAQALLKELLGR
ncbi:S46 family peptidase [Paucibacter sp. APW11]|uniref:Dipeptidyl-peptidase n=1 Tax=Roseateles aquae TaxID=3077235 RepID=A0ABU3PC86_9BURK|nr:S46 family peptidase [Paucibacter sp. APW11]MDT9000176.1 S46 family peptidase [Paucibacter sp. APW11]